MSLQSSLPVDCSVLLFAPWFHLHMLLTVSLSLPCCGTQFLIIIVQLCCWTCVYCLGWILDLLFLLLLLHPSNVSLPWFPYFFHLLSCLLVVAVCHINFSPFLSSLLIVVSFLVTSNEQSLLPFFSFL